MERILWVSPENERREGRKPIWSAPGGNRSAPLGVAETGGPLCKTLLEKLPPIFAVSPKGCISGADWRNACGIAEIAEIVT
jgi:hypothetical protein